MPFPLQRKASATSAIPTFSYWRKCWPCGVMWDKKVGEACWSCGDLGEPATFGPSFSSAYFAEQLPAGLMVL